MSAVRVSAGGRADDSNRCQQSNGQRAKCARWASALECLMIALLAPRTQPDGRLRSMSTVRDMLSPKPIGTEYFSEATAAVDRLRDIYDRNTSFLRDQFEAYGRGERIHARVRVTYPFVRVTISSHSRLDSRLSYGFVSGPGVYETTITRPDLFRAYLIEQIGLLMQNHGVSVEIGESDEPIPIHFAYPRDINVAADFTRG